MMDVLELRTQTMVTINKVNNMPNNDLSCNEVLRSFDQVALLSLGRPS